jgi:hypothetical protein
MPHLSSSVGRRPAAAAPARLGAIPLLVSLSSRLVRASPILLTSATAEIQKQSASEEGPENMSSEEYWTKLTISMVLVVTGGVFAG